MQPVTAETAAMANAGEGVPSPCVNVCMMSAVTGYCEGCQRTIAEIAGWSACSDLQKRVVLARLPARKGSR
jgi:hypothetical protein